MVEVALHQVRASDVRRDAVVGLERVDAAVLEEAADDRADVDVLGQAFDPGAEGARRAGDDVDLARPGRFVQLLDDLRVDEVVELEPDARVLPVGGRGGDARISSTSPLRRVNGATSSLRNFCGPPEPGDVVEEVRDVAVISSSAVKIPRSS